MRLWRLPQTILTVRPGMDEHVDGNAMAQARLPSLRRLVLLECEVTKLPDFFDNVFQLLPQLEIINNQDRYARDQEPSTLG